MRSTTNRSAMICLAAALAVCIGCGPDIEDPPVAAAKIDPRPVAPTPPKIANPPAPAAVAGQASADAPADDAAAPAGGVAMERPLPIEQQASDAIGIPPAPGDALAAGAPAAGAPAAETPVAGKPSAGPPAPAAGAPAAEPEPATNPAGDREAATAGVGEKGRGYGGGIVTEPIHQFFQQRQRIVFEIQIPKALSLWKVEHDNRPPASHAQFMKEIIEANNITLPDLPAGDKYVYDPQQGVLMVEHPAKPEAPVPSP